MKKNYYYAAMDECQTAIYDAIDSKRKTADYYRNNPAYKDCETGKTRASAEEQANEYDTVACEMEKIMRSLFNI